MSHDELAWLSAAQVAAAIRAKQLSPVEVVRAALGRIERHNPALNAFVTVAEGAALCAARKAEDAVMHGETLGPLHGVPLHVKDNLYVAGSRTTFGSLLLEHNVTADDCPAVRRLRSAGMIVVGRTNTPEFGWKGVTDNRLFGTTRNPWNTALTPGGSSGGAAAAVAAGLGPIGLGTDGGGSLRIPGSFCGVVGFKASFGRVPNWPGSGGAMLRHIGAITRTVADQALALDVAAGPNAADLLSLPPAGVSFASELDKGIEGKRLAFSPDLGYAKVEPETAAICRRAAERFAAAGARVVEAGLRLRGVDFANALAARHELWEHVRRLYERFDLLLCPALAVPPFAVGQDDAPPLDERRLGPLQWTQFTYPFNLTGQPAVSVPAGWTKAGLPIGLQIVGERFADLLVLQAARAWEQVQPWSDRRPPLGVG